MARVPEIGGAKVAVVLATYDGAAWVGEQIRSLKAQQFHDWRLFARDDGSTDATPALVSELARSEPRITLLPSGPRLGIMGNFAALLHHALRSGAEYVFPCDQDDVWEPAKMARALALMARLEGTHGRGMPLLVHSDLKVVDESLRPIHPSFLRFQGIGHEDATPLQVLLVQNFVTGCASLLNRPLIELALPLPDACIMHDWWMAQCAAACGKIGFDPEPMVLYRQHGRNQVGAAGILGSLNPLHAQGRARLARSWRTAAQTLPQARALHDRLRERGGASPEILNLVDTYARLGREPAARRLRTMRRLGIRRHRRYSTALMYVRMALLGLDARGAQAQRGSPPDARSAL